MIANKHLRECIIRPALDRLGLYSVAAEELLVITAAQESLAGTYLMQCDSQGYPRGPALGIYQMEPATFHDLWENFLLYHRLIAERIPEPGPWPAERLIYDLRFATQIARLHYYRFTTPIPDDVDGQIRYYKKYWNTDLGAASLAEIKTNYERALKAA